MTVAVYQPPQAPKKDPLDLIQQALGIATNVYGVAVDKQKADASIEANRLAKQQHEDELNKEANYKFATDYEIVPNNKPGVITPDQAAFVLPRGLTLPDNQGVRLRSYGVKEIDQANKDKEAANKPKDASAEEKQYAIFGKRLENSHAILSGLEADPELNVSGMNAAVQNSSLFPEVLKSDKNKSYQQAQRDFVNAVLRKESGASISPTEFESARAQYFPQAGDSPDIIAQKQANRELDIAAYKASAGNAWDKIPTTAAKLPVASKKQSQGMGEASAAPANSGFPKTVRNPKTNQSAIVSDDNELKDALNHGFQ